MNLDINRDLDVAFSTGAFLVSGDNVMTASWGFVGVMWGKKIFITPVRESRYTKTFIDIITLQSAFQRKILCIKQFQFVEQRVGVIAINGKSQILKSNKQNNLMKVW